MDKRLKALTMMGSLALASTAHAGEDARADVNFAVGGATTNSADAIDAFALQDPELALLADGIRAAGLDIIGLEQ